eukprot:CAMPEP_0184554166 /NCGR_PEP_ID=MMETSP0199_2-20130426/34277_1 /TAXON_ID=1112570 /ORGANISM="Thraustochytrium sp., Strain LLF1b" /LENGTH=31 /DNA_ID= /DNA_START= /DNA_END= /DNA_ORIENTATION=
MIECIDPFTKRSVFSGTKFNTRIDALGVNDF